MTTLTTILVTKFGSDLATPGNHVPVGSLAGPVGRTRESCLAGERRSQIGTGLWPLLRRFLRKAAYQPFSDQDPPPRLVRIRSPCANKL